MLHIHFNHHAHAEHWDLKVVYDDNSSKEWDHLNLDKITECHAVVRPQYRQVCTR